MTGTCAHSVCAAISKRLRHCVSQLRSRLVALGRALSHPQRLARGYAIALHEPRARSPLRPGDAQSDELQTHEGALCAATS